MCDDRDPDNYTMEEILAFQHFFKEYVRVWIEGLRLHAKILQESYKL